MTDINARTRLKLLAGAAGLALGACGGGSGTTSTPTTVTPPPPTPPPSSFTPTPGQLKNTFQSNFQVGAAVQAGQLTATANEAPIVADQFNSITAEFEMKADIIGRTEDALDFAAADAIVDFAEANGLAIRGHALLWHQSTPDYMLQGTPAEIRGRLEAYITDVMTRYRGRIFAWDVVNEVITDDDSATSPYRQSNWFNAVGSAEYIDWAFEAARAADPTAQLFINDYNTELSGKRGRYLQVIQDLQDRGIPIDGVGHQMHLNIASPPENALAAIDDVDNQFMGLIQHVTELDISVYDDPGVCFATATSCQEDFGTNVPEAALMSQAELYRALMNGFQARSSVTSVIFWGVSDGRSWLNSFPVNRTNYPLLYDRDYDAKDAFQAIVDPDFVI